MPAVTQIDNSPVLRVATKVKRGDALPIGFTIEGYASLVGHAWRAQLRKSGNRIASGFGITITTDTVTTPDDSIHIDLLINGAGTALLHPGMYVFDCEDVTTQRTWASGTVQVLADWSAP